MIIIIIYFSTFFFETLQFAEGLKKIATFSSLTNRGISLQTINLLFFFFQHSYLKHYNSPYIFPPYK